jgi:hypothetical protein
MGRIGGQFVQGRLLRATGLSGLMLAVGVIACAAAAMEIKSEHDRQAAADIARYRTYAWVPRPGGAEGGGIIQAVAPQVTRAVADTLRAKGYRQAEGAPDFLIGWDAAVEGKRELTKVEVGTRVPSPGARLPGPFVPQTVTVERKYDEGTLILEVVDAASGKLVWRGWAQAEVKPKVDAGQREARIREAVAKILDRFPPKP